MFRPSLAIAGFLAILAPSAGAQTTTTTTTNTTTTTVVGGGGSPTTDCLLVFAANVNSPLAKPRNISCTDGDPSCDIDHTVNGVCEFALAVCANSTFDPRCTLDGVQSITVDHAKDNGDPRFDPEFQALQQRIDNTIAPPTPDANVCTASTVFRLAVNGPTLGNAGNVCKRTRKTVRVTTQSTLMSGKIFKDKDKMTLTCNPAPPPDGCNPVVFFTDTFDRIQRQVFDRSCALSGCHDSQTHQNGLILESGASYNNLINIMPFNQAAQDAGWKRVVMSSSSAGDPVTSYIYRKVTGDLPDNTFGVRMPFHRAALDPHLIDVIMLWIQNGAPQACWMPPPMCWVPGTDQ
jgi:hypothetical protein